MTGARAFVIPLAAAAVLVAACGGGDGDGEVEVEGFEFSSPDGDYVVTFEEEPDKNEQTAPLPDGGTAPLDVYTDQVGDTFFAVSSIDYGAGTEVSLEGARDGAVANAPGAVLVESTAIELDGRAGLEYVADINAGAGDLIARVYADGTRLYQLIVVGEDVPSDDEELLAFFDSFRFTGGG